MQVFKFGGASVKDAAGVRNVARILQQYRETPTMIIISAMGKTTNALEEVVNAYLRNTGNPHEKLQLVRAAHTVIANELLGESHPIHDHINDILVEIEWIIEDTPSETYDYIYDQIVSIGEFLSTRIVAAFLEAQNMPTAWLDARDVIRTDNTYRDGNVNWADTEARMQKVALPLLQKHRHLQWSTARSPVQPNLRFAYRLWQLETVRPVQQPAVTNRGGRAPRAPL